MKKLSSYISVQQAFQEGYQKGYTVGLRDGEEGRMTLSPANKVEDAGKIIETCCAYFSMQWAIMSKKCRKREIVYARQITMCLLKRFTHFTLKSIGEMFNDMDHTTVIYALNLIKDLRETDQLVKAELEYLEEVIKQIVIEGVEVTIKQKQVSPALKKIWIKHYHSPEIKKQEPAPKIIIHYPDLMPAKKLVEEEEKKTPLIRHKGEYSNHSPLGIASGQ